MKKEYRYNINDLSNLESFRQEIGIFEDVLRDVEPNELRIDFHISKPKENQDYYIVLTEGMGAYRMNLPEEIKDLVSDRIELMMYLSSDWDFDFSKENNYWTIKELAYLSRFPHNENTWFGNFHTMVNDDYKSYAENNNFCAMMFIPYIDIKTGEYVIKKAEISGGEIVDFLIVVPIYKEELYYKKIYGGNRLIKELKFKYKNNDFLIVNPKRENVFTLDGRKEFKKYQENYQHTKIKLDNPEQIVEFEDEVFELAVRDLFDLKGIIRHKDIGYIESLDLVEYIRNGYVDIDKINIKGKVKTLRDLRWFTNLIEIGLSGDPGNPIFFGELKDLLPLKRLMVLNMGGVILKGDTSQLKAFKYLKDVVLTGQAITGDLKDFKDFKDLNTLYICDTRVMGDLKDIAHLNKIKNLTLSVSLFKGNIKNIENMHDLEELIINDTDLKGNVKSFSKLHNLKYLDFGNTNIKGDISELNELIKLEELTLYNTKITGDINSLRKLNNLRSLDIYGSSVKGDISFLKDFKCLHSIFIEDSDVGYDEEIINQLSKEMKIDILNKEEQDNSNDDSVYLNFLLHRQKEDRIEYVRLYNSKEDGEEIIVIKSGLVGEKGREEIYYLDDVDIEELIDKRKEGGFSDYFQAEKTEILEFYIYDYPRINALALIDNINNEIYQCGIGYVHKYKEEEDKLALICIVVDKEVAKTILNKEFKEYNISF